MLNRVSGLWFYLGFLHPQKLTLTGCRELLLSLWSESPSPARSPVRISATRISSPQANTRVLLSLILLKDTPDAQQSVGALVLFRLSTPAKAHSHGVSGAATLALERVSEPTRGVRFAYPRSGYLRHRRIPGYYLSFYQKTPPMLNRVSGLWFY